MGAISKTAVIGENVQLGEGVIIHDFAVIYPDTLIGDNVEVYEGCVIGKPPSASKAVARKIANDLGATVIGRGSVLSPHVVLFQGVKIGENTLLGDNASIREQCTVGDQCIISRNVSINYNTQIGNRVKIMDNTHITGNMIIEDEVFISALVVTTNDNLIGKGGWRDDIKGPHIKKGALIGAGANLLPSTVIGENAIVGASALVTRDVPENAIVKGVPAKITGYTNTQLLSDHLGGVQDGVKMEGPTLFSLSCIRDLRGNLIVGEYGKELPFEPKRIFMVYAVPSSKVRGAHAHKECHQFLIATQGSVNVILDDGKTREEYQLTDASVGLYIKPGIWGIQYKYSEDAVLLVLASHGYEASDYIRDYNEFLEWKKGAGQRAEIG